MRLLSAPVLSIIKYSLYFVLSQFFRRRWHSKLSLSKFMAVIPNVSKPTVLSFLSLPSKYAMVSKCSFLPLSFQFSCTDIFFQNLAAITPIVFSASPFQPTPLNQTVMVSLVEVIGIDQFLNRFSIRALKSKVFLEWLHNADIPQTRAIFPVKSNKGAHHGQSQRGIAQQLKTRVFRGSGDLVLRKRGTWQERQTLHASVAVKTSKFKETILVLMLLQLC